MAGKAKYAEKLAKHLGTEIDSACAVARPGSTAAGAVTAGVGGAVGAAAATAASQRAAGKEDIKIASNAWLGLGAESFVFVKGDIWLGRPKGDPIATVPYADVAAVELKEGKITTRADVALHDGRAFAFESKRIGANKPNVEVLEELQRRCAA